MNTVAIAGTTVAELLNAALPGVVLESDDQSVTVPASRIVEAALFLRDNDEIDAKFLNTMLGVDWLDHFNVVYVISSLAKNTTMVLKARIDNHELPSLPSVNSVWMGANLQEREVYDLMGIAFTDHPNLNRIFLWDGFPGHPLRKDFLALPQGYKPGLQRFPFEFPAGQRAYENLQDGNAAPPAVPRLATPSVVSNPESFGGQLGTVGGGVHGARQRDDLNQLEAPPGPPEPPFPVIENPDTATEAENP